ncbi:MAG: aryl-sulfate sulfotransferase [Balneolales bacterium]|nr:aryl-sulfate sulfotransferase [Balneolales bacterium]
MKKIVHLPIFGIAIFALLIAGCDSSGSSTSPTDPGTSFSILSDSVILNPSGYAPLTATITVETAVASKVDLRVLGKDETSNLDQAFTDVSTTHEIPVLGLYADYSNIVQLTFYSENDVLLGSEEYMIPTDPLIPDMPAIEIVVANLDEMDEGWTFVSNFGHRTGGNVAPQQPFMFDHNGDIRWFLDLEDHPVLGGLFSDNGLERLFNGNLYFGDRNSASIYEMDMLGNILNSWPLNGYNFHHQVLEKPNGNFVFTADKLGLDTVEDFTVEIDRATGSVVNEWDFRESLQESRLVMTSDTVDWFHGNAVEYDQDDNTIMVSGRTQGLVKFDDDNNVVWIMSNHNGWGTNGRGEDLNQYLLQPLDANNQPITDSDVLNGFESHPDFEWNWYQHAPQILPNGNVMLFDNGDNRNYKWEGPYSRAVEYEIDEENMTIKQVWQYGKERGAELFSQIVSDIDYNPETRHVFFSPGAIRYNDERYGVVVEVDYDTKEVLFEAKITPPQAAWNFITFHRTERMTIYPFSGAILQKKRGSFDRLITTRSR